MKSNTLTTAASYIASFPAGTQMKLKQMQKSIKAAAPKAEERISYGMPAYFLNGPLVYFGGYEKHIGFYPTGTGVAAFKKELAPYKNAKGSVQFPLDKPLPIALIKKMVLFKLKENTQKKR